MREITIPGQQLIDQAVSAPPPGLSLRSLLKMETAADHTRLDRLFEGLDLTSVGGYRRFLEINAAALLPLEQALLSAGVRDVMPAWGKHARTDAIVADLAGVGGRPQLLPAFVRADRFAILGTLYVLEGSRLGAAFLLKAVTASRDPAVAEATRYLAHGAGQRLWASFLEVLELHADELVDPDSLVGPARAAFDLFATAAARP